MGGLSHEPGYHPALTPVSPTAAHAADMDDITDRNTPRFPPQRPWAAPDPTATAPSAPQDPAAISGTGTRTRRHHTPEAGGDGAQRPGPSGRLVVAGALGVVGLLALGSWAAASDSSATEEAVETTTTVAAGSSDAAAALPAAPEAPADGAALDPVTSVEAPTEAAVPALPAQPPAPRDTGGVTEADEASAAGAQDGGRGGRGERGGRDRGGRHGGGAAATGGAVPAMPGGTTQTSSGGS